MNSFVDLIVYFLPLSRYLMMKSKIQYSLRRVVKVQNILHGYVPNFY